MSDKLPKLPRPATSPIPKTLQQEFARQLKRLSRHAKHRIEFILKNSTQINDETIAEIQQVLEQELGPEQARKFIERYTPVFWERGAVFAERMLKKYGIELRIPTPMFQVLDRETLDQLQNLQFDLIRSLTDEQKKEVARKIREGLLAGKSTRQITEDVLSIVDDTKWKAERIVRTETSRIFNIAAADRYERAGIKQWRWLTALDERVCPVCMGKHGKIIRDRSQLPPHASHPNCRCTVVPVIPSKPSGEKPEKPEPAEITGDKELDERLRNVIDEFEKIYKEDGSFVRSVNRFVRGSKQSITQAEREFKELYGKHLKGASKELKEHLATKLTLRINPDIIRKTNLCQITHRNVRRAYYDPIKKKIVMLGKGPNVWRTFLHEYGHHLENELYAEQARKFYLARVRKAGYKVEWLKKLYNYERPFGDDEYAFLGFDIEPYAGRINAGLYLDEHYKRLRDILENPKMVEEYKDHLSTEVVSVGLSKFENEETIKEFYKRDKEYFGFILALLRGDFI